MFASIDRVYLRVAVLYAVTGILGGIYMSASHDHSQMPVHAHWLLLGWVSMFLYGLFYKLYPATQGKLAVAQFWLANVGLILLAGAVGLLIAGTPEAEPVAALSSFIVLAGMILFAINVFRATRS